MNYFLRKLIRNDKNITKEEYDYFLANVWDNRIDRGSLIAFLAALSAKQLNLHDILGFVSFIDKASPKRRLTCSDPIVNIVGTGGGRPTFNISTTSALVAAAAGAKVLKSGSYSHNSQCGSLDVLKRLGIQFNLTEKTMEAMLDELNIGFVGPQMYSPLLRRIAVSIAPLTLRVIGGFINTIGPLLCPFQVHGQICGVSAYSSIEIFASALSALKRHNCIVVWSEIGLDEFSAVGKNHYAFVHDKIERDCIDPQNYGLVHHDHSKLGGGSPSVNAGMIQSVLKKGSPLVARDTVALNAAHMLKLCGRTSSDEESIQLAIDAIENGSAYRLLKDTIAFTNDWALAEETV